MDRSRTPPTLLRIFVCRQTHHPTKALNDRSSTAPTPPEVHLYTWSVLPLFPPPLASLPSL